MLSSMAFSCNKEEPKEINDKPMPETGYFKDVISLANNDTCSNFILIGDWGSPGDGLTAVSGQMAEVAEHLTLDFILTAGDNFYPDGVDSINDPYFSIYTENFNQSSLQVPWYISVGNHDHHGSIQAQIDYSDLDERWNFPSAFYKLCMPLNSYGDSLGIIVIDSQALKTDPSNMNQANWINSVAQNMDHQWKIMLGHHNLYSYGYHGESATMINLIEDVLYDNEIDIHFAGHEHDMQHLRTAGYTDFVISGSAGKTRPTDSGPLSLFALSEYGFSFVRVSKYTLQYYFINQYGDVVYSFERHK